MKITNEALEITADLLSNLSEQTGKLGFVIAYNKKKIVEASETYHEYKINLLKKYGTEEKDTGRIYIREEDDPVKYDAFIKEMGDTPKVEVEVDILKLKPEELYSGTLTTTEMANLMWMVEMPGTKEGDKQ